MQVAAEAPAGSSGAGVYNNQHLVPNCLLLPLQKTASSSAACLHTELQALCSRHRAVYNKHDWHLLCMPILCVHGCLVGKLCVHNHIIGGSS